jgi:hypothetical protein
MHICMLLLTCLPHNKSNYWHAQPHVIFPATPAMSVVPEMFTGSAVQR